jgi:hypothetical protein
MLKNKLHLHTLFVLFSLKSKDCYIKLFCFLSFFEHTSTIGSSGGNCKGCYMNKRVQ